MLGSAIPAKGYLGTFTYSLKTSRSDVVLYKSLRGGRGIFSTPTSPVVRSMDTSHFHVEMEFAVSHLARGLSDAFQKIGFEMPRDPAHVIRHHHDKRFDKMQVRLKFLWIL